MAQIHSYIGKIQRFVLFVDFFCLAVWLGVAVFTFDFHWGYVVTTEAVWMVSLLLFGGENPRLFTPKARIVLTMILSALLTMVVSVFTTGSRSSWHFSGGLQTLIVIFTLALFTRWIAANLLSHPGVLILPINLGGHFKALLEELSRHPHVTIEGSEENIPVLGLLSNKLQSTLAVTDLCLSEESYKSLIPLVHDIDVADISMTYEAITGKVAVVKQNGIWKLSAPFFLPTVTGDFYKRVFDVIFVLSIAPITIPIIVFAMLLVKLTSQGPALFTQDRLGRYGKRIRIYKIRTMSTNAESAGRQWAKANDNRVTPIGKFLRATGIDELPQLWNILRGEMSLIGPRPECPEIVDNIEQKIHFYRTRLMVLPGLTGWAQLHQGGDATIDDVFNKLLYDLYYIKHRSILLDFRIFLRTIQMLIHLAKPKPGAHHRYHVSPVTLLEGNQAR